MDWHCARLRAKKQLIELGRVVVIKNEVRGEFVKKQGAEFTLIRVEGLSSKRTEWIVSNKYVSIDNE